jgi:hypothetical protein
MSRDQRCLDTPLDGYCRWARRPALPPRGLFEQRLQGVMVCHHAL